MLKEIIEEKPYKENLTVLLYLVTLSLSILLSEAAHFQLNVFKKVWTVQGLF